MSIRYFSGISISAVLLLVLALISGFYQSWFLSFLSLLTFLFFLATNLKHNSLVIIPLLGMLFIRVTELLSGVLVERGGYLTETDVIGQETGAFTRLPLYYFLFFSSVVLGYNFSLSSRASELKVRELTKNNLNIALIVIALVVISGLLAGLIIGFPFLQGINRFSFRSDHSSSLLTIFLNNRFFCVVVLGLIYSVSSNFKKILSMLTAIIIVVLSILHGEQFTSMISLVLAFYIAPLLMLAKKRMAVNSRVYFIGMVAAILAVCVVLAVYSRQSYVLYEIVERRLLLQGQLWFVTDGAVDNIVGSVNHSLARNIESFLFWKPAALAEGQVPFGMRELMHHFAVTSVYETYLENGVTFTMGQMAVLLYWFGYVGMIIPIFVSALAFGLVVRYFNYSIFNGDILSIFISSKIFVWFLFGLQQGEYWYLFGIKTLMFCLAAYLFEKYRWFFLNSLSRVKGGHS